jgi:hypothetical protein
MVINLAYTQMQFTLRSKFVIKLRQIGHNACSLAKISVTLRTNLLAVADKEAAMLRQRVLKIVLVLVGLFFSAAIYPAIGGLRDPVHSDTGDTMMMALYFALGVFLLLAVRNPTAHRSLIAFAAWSSFAHATVMSLLGLEIAGERTGFLIGSAVLVLIGAALIVLAPVKQAGQRAAAA